ncbi:MAG TPA: hypothetical protein V6D33_16010 [Cyanophyceae cyanobacterium]
MTTENIQLNIYLTPENYQQLQEYMISQNLSETAAINDIIGSYLADKTDDNFMARIDKLEQEIRGLKRHLLAIRFRRIS